VPEVGEGGGAGRLRLNAIAGLIEHQIAPQWIRLDEVLG